MSASQSAEVIDHGDLCVLSLCWCGLPTVPEATPSASAGGTADGTGDCALCVQTLCWCGLPTAPETAPCASAGGTADRTGHGALYFRALCWFALLQWESVFLPRPRHAAPSWHFFGTPSTWSGLNVPPGRCTTGQNNFYGLHYLGRQGSAHAQLEAQARTLFEKEQPRSREGS